MPIKRRDINHSAVKNALRSMGCRVCDTADLGKGVPDLLISIPGIFMIWVEVKNGALAPSAQKLTEDEAKFHEIWKDDVIIMRSVEDAIEFVNMTRRLESAQKLKR